MKFLNQEEIKAKITDFAKKRIPFLFVIDSTMNRGVVHLPDDAAGEGILFNFNGIKNYRTEPEPKPLKQFGFNPVPFKVYETAFNQVVSHISRGDTYLLNLTFPSTLMTQDSLEDIFFNSAAPYKLLVKDQFVVFSPEIFVRIKNKTISSYPMKGTINASIPGAETIILADEKEFFEHNTIVDLIRNDLAMISTQVNVSRFRYIERIHTNRIDLLQVSSEITGKLQDDFLSELGDLLFTLLPAGSVTGAPKEKTLEIIRKVEPDDRGFYTGVCGFFDGSSLDSAVMIRFIERTPGGQFFRSGGGITALSDIQSEYRELTDKIYVPVI